MKKFWKSVGIAAAWFAAFLGIQFWISLCGSFLVLADVLKKEGISVFLNAERFTELYMGGVLRYVTLIVLISNLLTIAAFWIFYLCRKKSFADAVGLHKTSGKNLVLSILFGFGVCFTVDLLTRFLPIPEDMMEAFMQEHSMLWYGDAGLTFLSVALVGPVSEEICFRGLIYTQLKKGMKTWIAAVLSSVLFGLAHGNPVWFLVGFLAGLALSWVYEITGSLYACILVHVTNNAIANITTYVPLSDGANLVLTVSGLLMLFVSAYFLFRENRKIPVPEIPEETPVA